MLSAHIKVKELSQEEGMETMNKIRNMSLVYQLSFAIAGITLLVFAGLTVFASTKTERDAIHAVEAELTREVALIANNLEFFHETLAEQANQLSDVFFKLFSGGPIDLDERTLISVGGIDVPALVYQGKPINNDFSKPDAFTETTGGAATVFLRYKDDFLRISTSLRTQDGSRAFGTMLGSAHPGYSALMKGEAYMGLATLFGRHYMTKYVPIKRSGGEVIGILFIGFDYTKQLSALKTRLAKVPFGRSGYLYSIDAKPGPQQGTLLMHPRLEGKNLFERTDARGKQVFRSLLDDRSGILHYDWADETGAIRDKIVAYQRVAGWDWVVAAGSYTDEFTQGASSLRRSLMVVSAVCAALIIALIFLVLRRQLRPLERIGDRMALLGQGDLSSDVGVAGSEREQTTHNEVLRLARQVRGMIESLRTLIIGISESVQSLTAAAQHVSGVTAQTNVGVKSQQLETDQVATAINQMATTVQEVARSASAAADETEQADKKAAQGGAIVNTVISSMEALASEVEGASAVIMRVDRESDTIGGVLEVIRGIAEQTNLLALNAAIEAARAGEQGRGFAVVADEVRNLAQRTQVSTAEIKDVIQRLQASAKEAVAVMESGRGKAQDNVHLAVEAGSTLTDIARSTSTINGVMGQIAASAEEQNAVAEEINRSVVRIRDIASDTAHGADQMSTATDELQRVADQLQTEVARFRL
jgi:methyl-accepting chemotaxis protein